MYLYVRVPSNLRSAGLKTPAIVHQKSIPTNTAFGRYLSTLVRNPENTVVIL